MHEASAATDLQSTFQNYRVYIKLWSIYEIALLAALWDYHSVIVNTSYAQLNVNYET